MPGVAIMDVHNVATRVLAAIIVKNVLIKRVRNKKKLNLPEESIENNT